MFGKLSLLIGVLLAVQRASASVNYQGHLVLRVYPSTDQNEQNFLLNQLYNKTDCGCSVWRTAPGGDRAIDVMLAPNVKQSFISMLQQHRFRWQVLIQDVGAVCQQSASSGRQEDIDNTFKKINATVKEAYVFHYGASASGKALMGVRISFNNGNARRVIVVRGTTYGNSWQTITTVMYLINMIISNGKKENSANAIIRNFDWVFLPNLNPDGYIHSYTQDRLWTKNTHKWGNCVGVTLHDNFQYTFHRYAKPCNDFGPGPLSEPETKFLNDFNAREAKSFLGYVIIEPYGREVYFPAGPSARQYGQAMVNAMRGQGSQYNLYELPPGAPNSVSALKDQFRVPYPFYLFSQDNGSKGFCTNSRDTNIAQWEAYQGIVALAQQLVNSPEYKMRG